jgi:hypothetical protein
MLSVYFQSRFNRLLGAFSYLRSITGLYTGNGMIKCHRLSPLSIRFENPAAESNARSAVSQRRIEESDGKMKNWIGRV